jgi:hypothetical protein
MVTFVTKVADVPLVTMVTTVTVITTVCWLQRLREPGTNVSLLQIFATLLMYWFDTEQQRLFVLKLYRRQNSINSPADSSVKVYNFRNVPETGSVPHLRTLKIGTWSVSETLDIFIL